MTLLPVGVSALLNISDLGSVRYPCTLIVEVIVYLIVIIVFGP